jgi:hypothetical protein
VANGPSGARRARLSSEVVRRCADLTLGGAGRCQVRVGARDPIPVRSYELHLDSDDVLDDLVDVYALFRNVASAVPDIAFRERFEHPMPTVFLEEIEEVREMNSIAMGRPLLVPGKEE